MHITPAELAAIDREAEVYAAEDRRIHEEAIEHRAARKAANSAPDPDVVHSFTTRRLTLADKALSDIQARLSPESFAGFQKFLTEDFQKTLHVQAVRQAK